MKKIAFAGSSGTGKTTLAEMLAKGLGLDLCPVGSRSVSKEMGFDSPYDVDRASVEKYRYELDLGVKPEAAAKAALATGLPDFNHSCRELFQARLLAAKTAWEIGHSQEGFVTDRTVVDNLAYTALHNIKAVDADTLNQVAKHILTYDVIFFTPVSVFYHHADDNARVADLTYHHIYEMFVLGLLRQLLGSDLFSQRVVTLGMKDLAFRKHFVMNYVRGNINAQLPPVPMTDLQVFDVLERARDSVDKTRLEVQALPVNVKTGAPVMQTWMRLSEAGHWVREALKGLAQ